LQVVHLEEGKLSNKVETLRWYSKLLYYKTFIPKVIVERRIQALRNGTDGFKLNIGCGDGWHKDGWIGLDWAMTLPDHNHRKGIDVNWDVRRGLPFKDNSVKLMFASHVLEHFTSLESAKLLAEIYRVLEEGGVLRVVVPDLDIHIGKFTTGASNFFSDFYHMGGHWQGNITDTFLMLFYSDPAFNGGCHKYAYNFENLSYRLEQAGFKGIRRSGYMRSAVPEFNDRTFDSTNPKVPEISLYCEAVK
jgi:SAM-dependent methyltransferase